MEPCNPGRPASCAALPGLAAGSMNDHEDGEPESTPPLLLSFAINPCIAIQVGGL